MKVYVYPNAYVKDDADAVLLVSHKQFQDIIKNGWPEDAEILLAFTPDFYQKNTCASTMKINFKESFSE